MCLRVCNFVQLQSRRAEFEIYLYVVRYLSWVVQLVNLENFGV